jgi:hypothetical protein
VFDVVEPVTFWLGLSRHNKEQGEFEETCNERVVSAKRRAVRTELISMRAMRSCWSRQWSGYASLETPFEKSWVCCGLEAIEKVDVRNKYSASFKSKVLGV